MEKYSNLYLTQITKEQHKKTCNYWFIIQNNFTSHIAFEKREDFLEWLNNLNLKIEKPLVAKGIHQSQKIIGEYYRKDHLSYDEFYNLDAIKDIKGMSNGSSTLMRITEDENGIRTLHAMNCNCKYRIVYHHDTGAMLTQKEYDNMRFYNACRNMG